MTRAMLPLTLLAAALPIAASAQEDPRIVEEQYSPDAVYAISISAGHASVVQLEGGEVVESIVVGDPEGWLVEATASADRVVVKPTPNARRTNMVVLTTKRSYTFTLDAFGGVDVFVMRFDYGTAEPVEAVQQSTYRMRGDRDLYPRLVSDNGRTTSIFWPGATPFPAIFVPDASGSEIPASYRAAGDGLIVEGVHDRLVFRRDRQEATATRRSAK